MEINFNGPPLRTDDICIGTLQLASKKAAFRAANAFPDLRCAMWAQVDEVGVALRGILLDKPWFREAKTERIRWDDLKNHEAADLILSEALDRLTEQLRG